MTSDAQIEGQASAASSDLEPPPVPQNGAGPAAGARRHSRHHSARRKGPRSALNLARRLRADRELTPSQALLLSLTARLATHAANASLQLCEEGEVRQDGEPRALLSRLIELGREVRENLRTLGLLEDSSDDPLAALMGGQRR